jgi:hypothetical protein
VTSISADFSGVRAFSPCAGKNQRFSCTKPGGGKGRNQTGTLHCSDRESTHLWVKE